MTHKMIRPAWSREQMAEAASLIEFIAKHEAAYQLPDALLASLVRLRDVLGGEFGGTKLECIGHAWKVMGPRPSWQFRNGPIPESRPGPLSPHVKREVYVLRAGPENPPKEG